MPIPTLFGILIIFILWLHYEIRKSKRLSTKRLENFWQAENASNFVRRVDITNLNYLTIPLDRLPLMDREDPSINSYRDTIVNLSGKKILNLTGITNTELKLKYGASNITPLSEADNNYTLLVSFLHKWGERLYSFGYVSDAVTVLEFASSIYTDVSKTYKLLAKIYIEQNTPEKLVGLIEIIPNTKMLKKDVLIQELNTMKNIL